MQLGEGRKNLCDQIVQYFLSVINDPEFLGVACNYVDNGINLDPGFTGITTGLSLPDLFKVLLLGEAICVTMGVEQSFEQIQENVFSQSFHQ